MAAPTRFAAPVTRATGRSALRQFMERGAAKAKNFEGAGEVTMKGETSLQDPDPAALERSARLEALIRARIAASPEQILPFDEFVDLALYAPGLGYYAAPNAIFGRLGDFITAPESGELFAACLAQEVAALLSQDDYTIVEYGAGSGRLAGDLLTRLIPQYPTLRYHIVEPNPTLVERQRVHLAGHLGEHSARLSWSPDHQHHDQPVVVLANEVLDAMPFKRYRVTSEGIRELGVAIRGDALEITQFTSLDDAVAETLRVSLAGFPDGYETEVQPALGGWLRALRKSFSRGVVLLSDYGYPEHEYFHPDRSAGTMKCHFRHQLHTDPLARPGLQDLTVAVNFTAAACCAEEAGFDVCGFATQTRFLLNTGLEAVLAQEMTGVGSHDYTLAQEAKRLLLPGEMGETCKFLGLAADCDPVISGFADDERHRLVGPVRAA